MTSSRYQSESAREGSKGLYNVANNGQYTGRQKGRYAFDWRGKHNLKPLALSKESWLKAPFSEQDFLSSCSSEFCHPAWYLGERKPEQQDNDYVG